MSKLTKVFEREDGYAEYDYQIWDKHWKIEEWEGEFTVSAFLPPHNTYKSIEQAISEIKCASPKFRILSSSAI